MDLSVKYIFLCCLIATVLSQIGPNLQAANSFSYLPIDNTPPASASVPNIIPGGSVKASTAPSLTTASPNSPSPINSPGANTPLINANPSTASPNTLLNIFKNDLLTINLTEIKTKNTGS